MRLRLYHHPDGARVAYREAGTGPPLVLLHSAMLSHREFEPVVEHLAHRFRARPARPAAARRLRGPPAPPVHARLVRRGDRRLLRRGRAAPRPLVGGHGLGAEILLRASRARAAAPGAARADADAPAPPARAPPRRARRGAWSRGRRRCPGLDRAARARRAASCSGPSAGVRLTRARQPGGARPRAPRVRRRRRQREPRALVGARSRGAGRRGARASCSTSTRGSTLPVLLLWADEDRLHPLRGAEEALDLLPDGQLRVLPGHRLPDRLRRPGRRRARARRVLRLSHSVDEP